MRGTAPARGTANAIDGSFMPHARVRRRLLALGCATAVLIPAAALAGCGSGGDDGAGVAKIDDVAASTAPTTTAVVDRDQALLDFASCMRNQGVDFPDPKPDANGDLRIDLGALRGIDQDDLRRGRGACAQELQDVQGVLGIDETERNDRFLEVARCLRENGLENVRDPQPGAPGPGALGIDPNDPDAQAAIQACRDLIGIPGSGE